MNTSQSSLKVQKRAPATPPAGRLQVEGTHHHGHVPRVLVQSALLPATWIVCPHCLMMCWPASRPCCLLETGEICGGQDFPRCAHPHELPGANTGSREALHSPAGSPWPASAPSCGIPRSPGSPRRLWCCLRSFKMPRGWRDGCAHGRVSAAPSLAHVITQRCAPLPACLPACPASSHQRHAIFVILWCTCISWCSQDPHQASPGDGTCRGHLRPV